jgi:hypothetical protein
MVPLLLSASVYLKPTLFAVSVILLILLSSYQMIWLKTKWVTTVLQIFLFLVVFTPWVVRNAIVMQAFIPLTTSNGSNFYGGNNSQANGGYESSEPYVLANFNEVDSNRMLAKRGVEWIRNNPGRFLLLLPAKAFRFFWPLAFGTSGTVSTSPPIFVGVLVGTIAFYALGLLGISRLLAQRCFWEFSMLVATPLALLSLSLLTFGAARFALPAFPALTILASLGVGALGKQFAPTQHKLNESMPL